MCTLRNLQQLPAAAERYRSPPATAAGWRIKILFNANRSFRFTACGHVSVVLRHRPFQFSAFSRVLSIWGILEQLATIRFETTTFSWSGWVTGARCSDYTERAVQPRAPSPAAVSPYTIGRKGLATPGRRFPHHGDLRRGPAGAIAHCCRSHCRYCPHVTPVASPVLTLDRLAGRSSFLLHSASEQEGQGRRSSSAAAATAVRKLTDEVAGRGVATHSSGNHAQALALAAQMRGIPAHIVMPSNASPIKRPRFVRAMASEGHRLRAEPGSRGTTTAPAWWPRPARR